MLLGLLLPVRRQRQRQYNVTTSASTSCNISATSGNIRATSRVKGNQTRVSFFGRAED